MEMMPHVRLLSLLAVILEPAAALTANAAALVIVAVRNQALPGLQCQAYALAEAAAVAVAVRVLRSRLADLMFSGIV